MDTSKLQESIITALNTNKSGIGAKFLTLAAVIRAEGVHGEHVQRAFDALVSEGQIRLFKVVNGSGYYGTAETYDRHIREGISV